MSGSVLKKYGMNLESDEINFKKEALPIHQAIDEVIARGYGEPIGYLFIAAFVDPERPDSIYVRSRMSGSTVDENHTEALLRGAAGVLLECKEKLKAGELNPEKALKALEETKVKA